MPKHLLPRLTPLVAGLALAACAHGGGGLPATSAAPNALDAWQGAIQVTPTPDEIRLAAHPTGLSGNQARALAEFHGRWMQTEGGEITVAAPNEGGYRVGTEARAYLVGQGAPAALVKLVGYDAAGQADAPVIVGFKRYSVATPNCGSWENLSRTFGNGAYGNLGCAVTSNMAAQVANPGDLVAPRTMDPADPGRRATVFDKYRKGETTSSAKDAQASGAVSQAIQ
ncbi:MAG TPA: CpaD family pilus assembly protein [Caulobacter sp.]|nr:CpaD family pilus assembly protein [Caulobacter sp.]